LLACADNANTSPNQTPFSYLSLSIEKMFLTGVPSWPLERTLLTTGALDALMRSRHAAHIRLETPELVIPYHPHGEPVRPTNDRPCGASIEASPELLADHEHHLTATMPGSHPENLITLRKLRQGKL